MSQLVGDTAEWARGRARLGGHGGWGRSHGRGHGGSATQRSPTCRDGDTRVTPVQHLRERDLELPRAGLSLPGARDTRGPHVPLVLPVPRVPSVPLAPRVPRVTPLSRAPRVPRRVPLVPLVPLLPQLRRRDPHAAPAVPGERRAGVAVRGQPRGGDGAV